MEFKFGLMVLDMKENGGGIKLMERANSGMSMEMSSTENGRMTRQMDMEYIHM